MKEVRCAVQPLEARRLFAAVAGSIDFGQTHQTIDGFGAAFNHYIGPQLLPHLEQASFYDMLANDLGASAVRGEISQNFEAGGNDNNDPNTFNWANLNTQPLANTLTFFKRMHERGTRTFLLTVWSPPYWMKTSSAASGGGFLRADYRAEFAEWVAAAVVVAKRDYNVDITAVSVQNEQFFHEYYPSSVMDNVMLRETTIAVQKKFAFEGLKTKILANEDLGFMDAKRWQWFNNALLSDPQIDRNRLTIGAHFAFPQAMPAMGEQLNGTGVPLWFTEAAGRPNTWTDGLSIASEISDLMTKANSSTYFFWQFDNLGNSEWNASSALLNDGVMTHKYHAAKHFYKYVRPGMKRVTTGMADATSSLAAFRDEKTGAATITLVNSGAEANEYTIDVSNLGTASPFRGWQSTELEKWIPLTPVAAGSTITLTLPAQSVVTLYNGADLPVQTGSGTYAAPDWIVKDAISNSSLRNAAHLGDLPLVQQALLTENVNAADPVTGWTALHAAAASPFSGGLAVMEYLIAHGANVRKFDEKGFTALHAVAANPWQRWDWSGQVLIDRVKGKIDALLNAGANVNAQDWMGRTPLHWAAAVPLMYSESTYNTSILSKLVSRGADTTIIDFDGRSAYDLATADYREPYVNYFASLGEVTNTTRPKMRYGAYNVDANVINLTTTENITESFTAEDVTIVNLDTNTPVTNFTLVDALTYGITIGKISFDARLPDGRYRMTIAAGAIADQAGLATNVDFVINFRVLRGDATGDGTVNFDDLLVVAQNYGKSNRRWTTGDFNGDNVVNFDDLLIVAQRYGAALSSASTTTLSASNRIKARNTDLIS